MMNRDKPAQHIVGKLLVFLSLLVTVVVRAHLLVVKVSQA